MVGARRIATLCALLAFAALVGAAPASAAFDPFTMGNPAFCTPKKPLRDFGLSKLPPVREVPGTGEELGRPAVSIYGAFTRIMSEPESFGYGFSEDNYSGPVKLDWTVTAQLWAIGPKGKAFREVDRTRMFIGELDAEEQPHISLDPLRNRRGFYRFDIRFTNRAGETLGSYSAYFKVVRPFWSVRLGLSRYSARPGQRILSRVENFGSEWLSYGEEFSAQRFEGGRWVPAPELIEQEAWFAWLGYLGAGGSGRCSMLSIPVGTTPGRYRVVKRVTRDWAGKGRSVYLAAPFRVLGR